MDTARVVRLCVWLLIAAQAVGAAAEDFTDEELAYGKASRVKEIKMLADGVATAEASKRRTTNRADKDALTTRISELKRALNEAKRRTPEDYARQRRSDQEKERNAIADMQKRQDQEVAADAERAKVSGNCPLRIDFATFAHLSDVDSIALFHNVDAATTLGLTPITAVVLEVTNRTSVSVEAWEMGYELMDGFGEVIYSGKHRNPLIRAGETDRIRVSGPHIPEAVQMRISVDRSKSENGFAWARIPEHKQVEMIVKKLEGADLLKHARP